jgi:hypothetical protein
MKFPLLPLGQRFAYQGDIYAKIGPMTARRERDGEQRLIARSAVIAPAESLAAPAPAGSGPDRPERWSDALDAYERELRSGLKPLEEPLALRLELALERARAAALETLTRPRPGPG